MNISQRLEFECLDNTRDLGGMITADGRRIRPGKLIRSGQLFFASENDISRLKELVGAVADFRTDKEVSEKPDPELGCTSLRLPILHDLSAGVVKEEKPDKDSFEEISSSNSTAIRYMRSVYSSFVESTAAISGYRRFIRLLLENENGAVLWHCTAGKDRAGFASILTESLLGVAWDDIVQDYLYTNACLSSEIERLVKHFGKNADEKRITAMKTLFSADEDFLAAMLKNADRLYSGLDGFITKALGVTASDRQALRTKYLEG